MVVKNRRRVSPPWWVRLPLYLALWPKLEFKEYRVKLQRSYLKKVRSGNVQTANRLFVKEALFWLGAAVQRVAYAIFAVLLKAT